MSGMRFTISTSSLRLPFGSAKRLAAGFSKVCAHFPLIFQHLKKKQRCTFYLTHIRIPFDKFIYDELPSIQLSRKKDLKFPIAITQRLINWQQVLYTTTISNKSNFAKSVRYITNYCSVIHFWKNPIFLFWLYFTS